MTTWNATAIEQHLMGNRWFAQQPAPVRTALATKGVVASFRPGQWIHSEGDTSSGLLAVLSGSVRIEVAIDPDRSILLHIAGQRRILGQSTSFGGGPRLISARAGEDSCLMMISDRSLQSLAIELPLIWRAISQLQYEQLEHTLRGNVLALGLCPRARIAAALIQLPSSPPHSGSVKVSQSDLAQLSGLSRKAVNGHLQEFQMDKLIKIFYCEVKILNRNLLKLIVETN